MSWKITSLRTTRAAFVAALVLCSVACPTDPDDGGKKDAGEVELWTEAFDADDAAFGSVSGVWGSGPSDVFIVGGDELGGQVTHFDGDDWEPMDVPDVPLLVWAYGWGADDVIAVGTGGGVIRYNGTTWTALDSGTDEDLWGVFGFGPNDVWIVGGDTEDGEPLLLHFDGASFTPHALGAEANPYDAHSLFKVWGIGGELFAVGQRGLIVGFDGSEWTRYPAGAEADDDFVSLWGTSASNIVAVGGRGNALIAHFDGSAWTTVAPSGVGGLNAVFLDESSEAFIGGIFGLAGRYDIAGDELTFEDTPTRHDVHAMWGDGTGLVYAVGGSFVSPHRGAVLVRGSE